MVTEAQRESLRARVAQLRGGEELIEQLDNLIADHIMDADEDANLALLKLVKLSNAFLADETFARQLQRKWNDIFG